MRRTHSRNTARKLAIFAKIHLANMRRSHFRESRMRFSRNTPTSSTHARRRRKAADVDEPVGGPVLTAPLSGMYVNSVRFDLLDRGRGARDAKLVPSRPFGVQHVADLSVPLFARGKTK